MDFSEYKPNIRLADKYEAVNWTCDNCGVDQVYVGDGRMMCAELDCESLFGNNDSQEHMTGSYADMNDLDGEEVENEIREFDSRLFNIIMSEDSEKKIEDILDNYKGAWAYASNYQLIEELELLYRNGIKGLTQMDYHEIVREWNEYQDDEGDKKDHGDRI
tara:strand:- start:28 stop:510 length:483 start_codon:yes stop_codon:yes gene_type:complete